MDKIEKKRDGQNNSEILLNSNSVHQLLFYILGGTIVFFFEMNSSRASAYGTQPNPAPVVKFKEKMVKLKMGYGITRPGKHTKSELETY